MWLMLGQVGHLVAALLVLCLVLAGYRYVGRRSRILGLIVGVAILVRLTLGLALFSISYLHLPVAESLQVSGGFWQPALDATGYYQMAATAATAHTLIPFDGAIPAPFFVNTLALWMMVVGISPAAGMFLNLCLYLGLMTALVRYFAPVNDWRRDLPCIVGVAAYSFSPVILFHSTQPLKDEFTHLLIATACFSVLALRALMSPRPMGGQWRGVAVAAVAFSLATLALGATRWYYPLIVGGSLMLTLGIFAVRTWRTSLPRYAAASIAILAAAWVGAWAGAGGHLRMVAPSLTQISEVPSELLNIVQVSRFGFLTSGGDTNIMVNLRDDPVAGNLQIERVEASRRAGAVYAARTENERLAARRRYEVEQLAKLQREAEARAQAREAALQAQRDREAALEARGRRDAALRAEREAAARLAALRQLTPGDAAEAEDDLARQRRERERLEQQEAARQLAAQRLAAERASEARRKAEQLAAAEREAARQDKIKAERALALHTRAGQAFPTGVGEQLTTMATGLAVAFVPVSLVRSFAGIELSGGRGLLSFADFDTVFLDTAAILVLALLWRQRRAIGDRLPFVVFGLILSGATAILLGYVVTNYGTLLRLRSMIFVPLWLLVVALSSERKPREIPADGPQRYSAST